MEINSGGGGGSTLELEVDGVPNGDQTLLNLVAGTGVDLVDSGTGSVTISVLSYVRISKQTFTTTGGGQTFTLSNTPTVVMIVIVNGQALNTTAGYTASGTGVTLVDTLTPSGLSVDIIYAY